MTESQEGTPTIRFLTNNNTAMYIPLIAPRFHHHLLSVDAIASIIFLKLVIMKTYDYGRWPTIKCKNRSVKISMKIKDEYRITPKNARGKYGGQG